MWRVVGSGGGRYQRSTQIAPHPAHRAPRAPLALRAALCTLTSEINHRASAEKVKAGSIGVSESTQAADTARSYYAFS